MEDREDLRRKETSREEWERWKTRKEVRNDGNRMSKRREGTL